MSLHARHSVRQKDRRCRPATLWWRCRQTLLTRLSWGVPPAAKAVQTQPVPGPKSCPGGGYPVLFSLRGGGEGCHPGVHHLLRYPHVWPDKLETLPSVILRMRAVMIMLLFSDRWERRSAIGPSRLKGSYRSTRRERRYVKNSTSSLDTLKSADTCTCSM